MRNAILLFFVLSACGKSDSSAAPTVVPPIPVVPSPPPVAPMGATAVPVAQGGVAMAPVPWIARLAECLADPQAAGVTEHGRAFDFLDCSGVEALQIGSRRSDAHQWFAHVGSLHAEQFSPTGEVSTLYEDQGVSWFRVTDGPLAGSVVRTRTLGTTRDSTVMSVERALDDESVTLSIEQRARLEAVRPSSAR